MKSRWMFRLLVLTLALSVSCRDRGEDRGGKEPRGVGARVDARTEGEPAQDLATLPQEAVNGLLLTAEVLDEEKWIVGLTWENVGEETLSVPVTAPLQLDIDDGYAAPFLADAYCFCGSRADGPRAVILDRGEHADRRVFDLSRDNGMLEMDAYESLRRSWGLRRSPPGSFTQLTRHMSLGKGDRRTCFLRFPRFRSDLESGRWKEGEKIPVEFRFFVGAEVENDPRVTVTSGVDGNAVTHRAPSSWRGEVRSNVVHLEVTPGGERVRWPASPITGAPPPEPCNGLLLTLEIVDEEKWIVRLKWKNVGSTPMEVPVVEALKEDVERRGDWGGQETPFPFVESWYTNYRFYGRPFGTALERGDQVDERLFDLNRNGKHASSLDAYEALLKIDGVSLDMHRVGGLLTDTEWLHLQPGDERVLLCRFPRFESDDRFGRWREGERIPLEFRFKAGETPNSRPPYREERIGDEKLRRRYPTWRGEVHSNVVFFTWTPGGERVHWDGKKGR